MPIRIPRLRLEHSGSFPKSRIIPWVVFDNRFLRVFRVDFDGAKRHVDDPRDKCSSVWDDGKATSIPFCTQFLGSVIRSSDAVSSHVFIQIIDSNYKLIELVIKRFVCRARRFCYPSIRFISLSVKHKCSINNIVKISVVGSIAIILPTKFIPEIET